jgi:TatA/E family protein of Tat protein translocase
VGSTELIFILVMALVFFGPRKLPQISRSLGKSLAEFRRASDEFKRTWEREVAIEHSVGEIRDSVTDAVSFDDFNTPETQTTEPRIEPISDERSVARLKTPGESTEIKATSESAPSKRDWL